MFYPKGPLFHNLFITCLYDPLCFMFRSLFHPSDISSSTFGSLCFSDLMILFLPPILFGFFFFCPAAFSSRRLAYRMKMGTLPNPKSPKKPVCKSLLPRIPLHLSALFPCYTFTTCSLSHYQPSSQRQRTQSLSFKDNNISAG